jgi:ABC-type nitrate/sulfonate/bicarbonate transport system substrate-binding protein
MYGVEENRVTLSPMDIIDMPRALEEGRVAAFTSWEPSTAMILKEHEDFTVIHRSQFSGYLYFSGEFVARAPEAARRIVAAQLRAMSWLQANDQNLLRSCRWAREAYQAAVGSSPSLSDQQLAQIVKSDLLDVAPIPEIPEHDLQAEGALARAFAFLQKLGQLPSEATWELTRRGFDRALINQVLQQAERYRLDEHRYASAAD